MRRLYTLLTAVVLTTILEARQTATVGDLAFISGCWRLEANGRTIEEQWLAPLGGSLMGVGRTVAGGKTVEYEFLQIRETADGLTYIAKPSGQAEASFKLLSKTADEVVFENPAHDFPQRIRYRRAGPDALHARIEGTMSGKSRGIDFPYTRTACPGGK
jgi:uncharacterized protein DUF6265